MDHLKPVWCPRCHIFQAGCDAQIMQHLKDSDCVKSEALNSPERGALKGKADDVEAARTWEKIYQILFPPQTPDPCENPSSTSLCRWFWLTQSSLAESN